MSPAFMDYEAGLPSRMRGLPRDAEGRPVPFFVAWVDGRPDFRTMDARALRDAVRHHLCWVCGEPMSEARGAFVLGPMCAVNRVSAEPPGHKDCAVYSATHCPFLTTPRRRRRGKDMPEGSSDPGGIMLRRNPGVALVWISRGWRPFDAGAGGLLFRIGEPLACLWYAEGRSATRSEVMASIDSGLPLLREVAERDGPAAMAELDRLHRQALSLVPA